MQNLKVKAEKKVPILGDIPLLGLLFKHKVTSDEKKELLIFLTPRIVKRPSDLLAHTANERQKLEAVKKAFTEEEINRYLEKGPAKDNPPPVAPQEAARFWPQEK